MRKRRARLGLVLKYGCGSIYADGVVAGLAVFLLVISASPLAAAEPQQNVQFPFGITALLSDRSRDLRIGSVTRPSSDFSERLPLSRYVFGPSGETWRISPGLTGAWITGPGGRSYRVSEGLTGLYISGPRGESWRVSFGLSGSAWISGPGGVTYRFAPSIVGGGWIYGPRGESWRVTESLSGSVTIR
ncbi:MAG: hypothetical protein NZ899_03240 [Thermoguttaceae bacterium]|nr:hypothetical protein [Thermoguttaceae bacterium]MDW8078870.1 hypothetical protein [Thermoguttaceae bacterium]